MRYDFVDETEKKVRIREAWLMDKAINEENPPLDMLLEAVLSVGLHSEEGDVRKASIAIRRLLNEHPEFGELLNAAQLLMHPFDEGIEGVKLFGARSARFRRDAKEFEAACLHANCADSA